MKVILKTYKYRLLPNKEQEEILARYFGTVRFVYNHFLAERKNQYDKTGKSDNYYVQAKTLTNLKKQEEYSWIKEVNSQTLQQSLRHLETAYTNFFRGNARFPRFKAKKNGGSFNVPQFCSVADGRIFIPKFKNGIKIVEHRQFIGKIKNMTISVTPSGKYFVSILSEVEYEPLQKTNAKVGIDLGIKDLVVTSDGIKYSSNKFIKHYSKELSKAQKHLSKKQKGSNSWNRQRIKVARIQEKIHNCRMDKLHKISTNLIKKYDVICCEDLNVKRMQRNHILAQSIADASWGTFITFLVYKAEMNGKQIVKIGRYYPSSKTCHHCGYVKEDLTLEDREWICPVCGNVIDRDLNAAINILNEGLKNISVGTTDYTDGTDVIPNVRLSTMKSEVHKSLVCEQFTNIIDKI